jgi:PAS domain S-box-containing protein
MPKKFSPSTRYALAVAIVAAATLFCFFLNPLLGSHFPFFCYYIAVIVTLWMAGFGPALAAAALGFLSGDLCFRSTNTLDGDPEGVLIYIGITLAICFFGKKLQHSKQETEIHAAEARVNRNDLDEEIARRSAAEQALRLSEEQWRASFESTAVGQAQLDPLSGRFLKVNAKLCQMLGYSEQELIGLTVRQITYPDDNEWDTKTFRKMLAGKSADAALEKRYVCKGGNTIWVSTTATVLNDKDGKPWRTVAVVHDISARRRAEADLKAAEEEIRQYSTDLEKLAGNRTTKLTETIQSLEGFCYGIAHDLRAPIRAMQTYATAMAEDLPMNEVALNYATRIAQASERMDQLVRDLLAYGRLTQENIDLEGIRLEPFLDQVLADLSDEIKSRRAQVYVLRPLPAAMGQPAVLKQVFVNLLHNAMTFVRPEIMPRIYIRAEETDDAVRICIDDNGLGVPLEHQERIFKVFERLHTNEEYPGTGIGLALVKKGVERMGGKVGVESHPDQGSCFWFELKKHPTIRLLPPSTIEPRLNRVPKVAVR